MNAMEQAEYIKLYGCKAYRELVPQKLVVRRQGAQHDVTILKDAERNITVEERFYIGD